MSKRPLCLAAILLMLMLWILPKDIWYQMPDIPSGEKIKITGTVIKREVKEDRQVYYLKNCLNDSTNSEFSMLAYIQKGDSYPVGCELSLYGTIYQLKEADNPGQFDAREYYQSQGILYTFQTENVISYKGTGGIREQMACLREYLGRHLMQLYNERDGGILKAVLLGDKSSLRDEDELLYQKNGISHLLAISGLHISMIGIGFYKLLRKCRLTFLEAGIPSSILLLLYGMMAGFGISTIRAVCMFVVMIFADIFGRAYDMASAMALAAIIILIRNPLQAWQAGFLLSFGAVAGICVVYPVLQSLIRTERKWARAILFSLSLTVVTYPITIHFFYEYSIYSTLLNFIVIPLMPVMMSFGGVSLLVGCVFPGLGKAIGIPAHLVLSFYELLGERVVNWPCAVLRLGREEPWQLVLYYAVFVLILLLLWFDRRRIYLLMLPIALTIVSIRFFSPLEFTMLDVGQGDGLFLRFPSGTTCFIDGGSANVKNLGTYRLLPYLKYEGVAVLDYVVFTHLDEDHISGMRELFEMHGTMDGVKVRKVLFPRISNPDEQYMEMWNLAREKGIPVDTIGETNEIKESEITLKCISPVKGSTGEDKNNDSTVLCLEYKEFSMLLSGDLGLEGEELLLQKNSLKNVDVWKVSHHGSKYSGGETFLNTIRPQLSLISVGKNHYGHPSRELIQRLKNVGSLLQTTLDGGALMIKSDGETYSLTLQRGGD